MATEYSIPLTPEEEEEWRPVVGYEGLYSVSDWGRVRRDKSGRGHCRAGSILKACYRHSRKHERAKGYFAVGLHKDGKSRTVMMHHLVAAAFLGPRPDGMEVNHKDGDTENNHAGNLEYLTQLANLEHARVTGLKARGERVGAAKLNPEYVRAIRVLCEIGHEYEMIGRLFGVSGNTVKAVHTRLYWSHVI